MKPIWMLDIETTGFNIAGNQISSIALVAFDDVAIRAGVTRVLREMACAITPLARRCDDPETIDWRNQQGVPMHEAALKCLPMATALEMMSVEMASLSNEIIVMAKPTFFDIAWVELIAREIGVEVPWHYRNVRDLATRVEEIGFNLNKEVEPEVRKYWKRPAHAALDDCHFQIECLRMAYMMRQVQNREEEHF